MHSKQTKIICTLADNRCEPEFIEQLVANGMNVVRLNTAHITTEAAEKMIKNIRKVSDQIGILIDTKGPEVRTCEIEQSIHVQTGDQVCITNNPSKPGDFKVSYDEFVNEIPEGSQILIDDGELELSVDQVIAGRLICTVQNDGVLKNKKSLNVPGVHLCLPTLTEQDGRFIDWATSNDVDFIAHSFVRDRDDVMAIQSILDMRKSNIKIIAKIENREGVDNLDSILDVAYSVMVARGDLGIEIPAEEVPFIQKNIIRTCIQRLRPVITATQMLHSMIENPRPTRAEVSDVANAIIDGTDAIMLSGETAYGKFPIEAVQTMSNIAHAVEQQKDSIHVKAPVRQQEQTSQPGNHLAKAAVTCANDLPIQAIITSTKSGSTAMLCASYRGQTPIFALSEKMETVRQLSLCHGVYSLKISIPKTTDELVKACLEKLLDENKIDSERLVAFLGGGHIYSHHTNFMQIETPARLLRQASDHS